MTSIGYCECAVEQKKKRASGSARADTLKGKAASEVTY